MAISFLIIQTIKLTNNATTNPHKPMKEVKIALIIKMLQAQAAQKAMLEKVDFLAAIMQGQIQIEAHKITADNHDT